MIFTQIFFIKLNNKLTDKRNDLLLCKGVYPYKYVDFYELFYETELPTIQKFYSQLSESNTLSSSSTLKSSVF